MNRILPDPIDSGASLSKSDSSAFHSFFHIPAGTLPQQFLLFSRAKIESFLPHSNVRWEADLPSTEKLNRPKGYGL
jgi:hypothetical protein